MDSNPGHSSHEATELTDLSPQRPMLLSVSSYKSNALPTDPCRLQVHIVKLYELPTRCCCRSQWSWGPRGCGCQSRAGIWSGGLGCLTNHPSHQAWIASLVLMLTAEATLGKNLCLTVTSCKVDTFLKDPMFDWIKDGLLQTWIHINLSEVSLPRHWSDTNEKFAGPGRLLFLLTLATPEKPKERHKTWP